MRILRWVAAVVAAGTALGGTAMTKEQPAGDNVSGHMVAEAMLTAHFVDAALKALLVHFPTHYGVTKFVSFVWHKVTAGAPGGDRTQAHKRSARLLARDFVKGLLSMSYGRPTSRLGEVG